MWWSTNINKYTIKYTSKLQVHQSCTVQYLFQHTQCSHCLSSICLINYNINTVSFAEAALFLEALRRKFTGCQRSPHFCYYGGEVLITLNCIYFGSDFLYLCVLFLFISCLEKCVWKYLKVGRGSAGFFIFYFGSLYFQHPNLNNNRRGRKCFNPLYLE